MRLLAALIVVVTLGAIACGGSDDGRIDSGAVDDGSAAGGDAAATCSSRELVTAGGDTGQALPAVGAACPNQPVVSRVVPNAIYAVSSWLSLGDTTCANNSNIYLIRGATCNDNGRTEVWMFGAGYGDPPSADGNEWDLRPGAAPLGSAAIDAASILFVLDTMFELDPSEVDLRFIAPHFHLDHINAEMFIELFENRGVHPHHAKLFVHEDDLANASCDAPCCGELPCNELNCKAGSPSEPSWTSGASDYRDKMESFAGSAACGDVLWAFESVVGLFKVLHDGRHTDGSVALESGELDVRITGGADSRACTGETNMPCAGFAAIGTELHVHGAVSQLR